MVCGHDELSALIENRWIDRLWNSSPPSLASSLPQPQQQLQLQPQPPALAGDQERQAVSYSRADEAKWALSVADRWEMKRLRGVAYYVCLMEMGDDLIRVAQGTGTCDTDGTDRHEMPTDDSASALSVQTGISHNSNFGMAGAPPPLTSSQITRLLLGHLSLTHLWDNKLQIQAPGIPAPHPGSCTYHQHGCIYTWVTSWREAARSPVTLKYKTNDVVGRVRSMEKQLVGNDGLIVALTPGCRRKALVAVREMVKALEEGLGEHFRGAIGGEV